MTIPIECSCGARLNVKDEMAGRTGKCPKCGNSLMVPTPSAQPPSTAGLAFADETADRPAAAPPCPGCKTQYPEDVVICTTCGIEILTGQRLGGPPASGGERIGRQPLRSRGSREQDEKSFFQFLGEAYYRPTEAFDALGYYILHSRTNLLLVIGFFLVSLLVRGTLDSQEAFSFGAAMLLAAIIFPIALLLKAAAIDVVARILTGASRFLPLAVVLLFLEGLVGMTSLVLLPLSPDLAETGALAVTCWGTILYFIVITKTYDISWIYAVAIAIGAGLLEEFLVFGLVFAVLAGFFGLGSVAG